MQAVSLKMGCSVSEWVFLHKEILAQSVWGFHLIFALWLMLGGFGVMIFDFLKKKWLLLAYAGSVATTVFSQLLFQDCPLTLLERTLKDYGQEKLEIKAGFVTSLLQELTGFSPPEVVVAVAIWLLFIFATFLVLFYLLTDA